mmetsp:Transcript_57187/g.136287  ORF Transcript_57187/g.136287 Transcript_57187/m.136287 type:complete len:217 (-) Transcript_57187:46-696(-)
MAGIPTDDIGLAVHELHIMRALSITVASAILGPGYVGATTSGLPAICIHLHKVHGAVQAAGHVEHVHRQSKLSVLQLEDFVHVGALQHVDAGTKVRAILGGAHKVQPKPIVDGIDAVCLLVVFLRVALHMAICSTARWIRAQRGIPIPVLVAVGVLAIVDPPPIGVQDQLVLLGRAAARFGALLHGHGRIAFRLQGARLLRTAEREQKKQDAQSHG